MNAVPLVGDGRTRAVSTRSRPRSSKHRFAGARRSTACVEPNAISRPERAVVPSSPARGSCARAVFQLERHAIEVLLPVLMPLAVAGLLVVPSAALVNLATLAFSVPGRRESDAVASRSLYRSKSPSRARGSRSSTAAFQRFSGYREGIGHQRVIPCPGPGDEDRGLDLLAESAPSIDPSNSTRRPSGQYNVSAVA